jgi:hypothetical protein
MEDEIPRIALVVSRRERSTLTAILWNLAQSSWKSIHVK